VPLAGFAASDMDFVNSTGNEPPRQDTFPTTTSGVMPPLINFLRVKTTSKGSILMASTSCNNRSRNKELF